MIPAVPLPADSNVRRPVDFKLKANWQFDKSRRIFVSASGDEFDPRGTLPKNSKVVYKVPSLAEADVKKLSKHERELCRYMQVILPAGESPSEYVEAVGAWPPVAEANAAPEISLPSMM